MQRVIALIAHDSRKSQMLAFCGKHRAALGRFSLIATGTTGARIAEMTGLPVECVLSGQAGGDLQIAARVATGDVAGVFFLCDPAAVIGAEPDVKAFIRVCAFRNVPLALNFATAELVLRSMS